jgi:hypothetical protein
LISASTCASADPCWPPAGGGGVVAAGGAGLGDAVGEAGGAGGPDGLARRWC